MGTPKKGKVFLLKAGDGASPEVFTTVAGLRATSYQISSDTVDVTDKDSEDAWRELLDGGGIKSMSISADGTAESGEQTQVDLRARALVGSIDNYHLDDGEYTIECGFQVTQFSGDGPLHDGQTFSISLESSGKPAIAQD